MRSIASVVGLAALAAGLLVACSTAPSSEEARDDLVRRAAATLREWDRLDPGVEAFATRAHAYALFPEVTKGGLVFGGAYGRGVAYEQGRLIGYADLTQGTFGLQVGGQTYSELIVFRDPAALERFKRNQLDFSADATAVVFKTGAAASARFVDGVAVIVRPTAGAMAEAAIGGQQLSFVPR